MIRFAIVPALLGLPTLAAHAQAAPDTSYVPPVVVTATRMPLRSDQVPASATVLGGDELRARGVVHLLDALRGVPGAVVAQSGSWGAPASVFVRGGQSNYTKVLIDGVPANEPGGAFDFGTLVLDDVERIEIVRGPSSVVWGSDAVSAVVHVITRRGAADRIAIEARGGSLGTRDVSGSVDAGSGALRGAITGAHHRTDGIFDFNSAYRHTLASGSASWLGRATSGRVGARHGSTRAHFPTDFTGAPVDLNSYRTEERTTLSLDASRAIGPATVHLVAGHGRVSGSSSNPADEVPGLSDTYDTRTRRQQLELRTELPLRSGVSATVGGVLEWQHRATVSTFTAHPGDAPPSVDRTSAAASRANRGAFVELLAGSAATTVTAGTRLDHNAAFGDFATYRVGVSHQLSGATRLRGSVGTAFREPSFDEVLPSPFSTGNDALRPERTASWEVGAEQGIAAGRVVVGATWFAQRFVNMIDYYADSFPGRYENVAAARARGVELEARARATRTIAVDGNVTVLRTRVESAGFGGALADGRPLLRRPERTGALGLTYAAARGTASARLAAVGSRPDVRYTHEAPYAAEERLPGYAKLDFAGSLPLRPLLLRAASLTLRIDNALNAGYEPAAGYRAPPRTLLVGARAEF